MINLASNEQFLPLDLLPDHLGVDFAHLLLVEVDVGPINVAVAISDGEPGQDVVLHTLAQSGLEIVHRPFTNAYGVTVNRSLFFE